MFTISNLTLQSRSRPRRYEPGDEDWSLPYEESQFDAPTQQSINSLPIDRLATCVMEIVRTEGPVHRDEVARRIVSMSGQRLGSRIAEAIAAAIRYASKQSAVLENDDFLTVPGAVVRVRNREFANSATLRKAEFIPPAEVREAISRLIEQHVGLKVEELAPAIARLLGFRSTPPGIRQIVERELANLQVREVVSAQQGRLYRGQASPELSRAN